MRQDVLETIDNTKEDIRHDWSKGEVKALFNLPFNDLLFWAHSIHRKYHNPNEIQISTLCSIKTGSCPENCSYCPQSAHYDTGLEKESLMDVQAVLEDAKKAKEAGSTRFCMGAAWRGPSDRDLPAVIEMIKGVKALGMESCVTLGLLKQHQAVELKEAGLDYYNHNIDTSEEFYDKIITTRNFKDRLDTLDNVRNAGINVCCGGILGMGEGQEDRGEMLRTLANMDQHPESVPINQLIAISGTPLEGQKTIDGIDFVRTIAAARVMMPKSYVRLSAGREEMTAETQAMCFFAGANSMFYGEKLLTAENPDPKEDKALLAKLGITAEQ